MTWNFNMKDAPKGEWKYERKTDKNGKLRHEKMWESIYIITASKCGKVMRSRWLEDKRWEGYKKGEEPIAWQPWPEHPDGL